MVSTHVESHAAAPFPQCQRAGGADETQHAVCTGLVIKLDILKLNRLISVPLFAPNRIANITLPNPPIFYHCLDIQVISSRPPIGTPLVECLSTLQPNYSTKDLHILFFLKGT